MSPKGQRKLSALQKAETKKSNCSHLQTARLEEQGQSICVLLHLVLTTPFEVGAHRLLSHFTDEETDAQVDLVICPKVHS